MGSHTNTTNQVVTKKKITVVRKSSPKRGFKMMGGMNQTEFDVLDPENKKRIIREFLTKKGYDTNLISDKKLRKYINSKGANKNTARLDLILLRVASKIVEEQCNYKDTEKKRLADELQKELVASLSGVSSTTINYTSATTARSAAQQYQAQQQALHRTQLQEQLQAQQQPINPLRNTMSNQTEYRHTNSLAQFNSQFASIENQQLEEAKMNVNAAVENSNNTAIEVIGTIIHASLETLKANSEAAAKLNIERAQPGLSSEEKTKLDQEIQKLQNENQQLQKRITEQQENKTELETLKKKHAQLELKKTQLDQDLRQARANNQTSKVNELTSNLGKLQTKIDKVNAKTKQEIEDANTKNKKLTEQLSAQSTQSATNKQRISELEAKVQEFEAAKQKMKAAEEEALRLKADADLQKKASEEAEITKTVNFILERINNRSKPLTQLIDDETELKNFIKILNSLDYRKLTESEIKYILELIIKRISIEQGFEKIFFDTSTSENQAGGSTTKDNIKTLSRLYSEILQKTEEKVFPQLPEDFDGFNTAEEYNDFYEKLAVVRLSENKSNMNEAAKKTLDEKRYQIQAELETATATNFEKFNTERENYNTIAEFIGSINDDTKTELTNKIDSEKRATDNTEKQQGLQTISDILNGNITFSADFGEYSVGKNENKQQNKKSEKAEIFLKRLLPFVKVFMQDKDGDIVGIIEELCLIETDETETKKTKTKTDENPKTCFEEKINQLNKLRGRDVYKEIMATFIAEIDKLQTEISEKQQQSAGAKIIHQKFTKARKSATHKKRHTQKRLQMVPQTLKLTRRNK